MCAPQDECIARMVEVVREEHAREPRTLFVIGAYSIGKVRQHAGSACSGTSQSNAAIYATVTSSGRQRCKVAI